VVIETSETECVARVRADQHRPHKENIDGIVTWWLEYDRRPGETVISRA
jgi:hypothetical protein